MIWLGWRQMRAQFMVAAGLVVAYIVLLIVESPTVPASATDVLDLVNRTQRNLYQAGIVLLAVVAPVIGAFWGAPTVARELELGTHRLVWSQSVTRRRWIATKLTIGIAASAVAVGALTLATTQWASRLDGATASQRGSLPSRLTPVAFAMRGVVPVGYAVFAFVLGVVVGMMMRRVLPAMAITIALIIAVQVAFPILIRPSLLGHTTTIVAVTEDTFDGLNVSASGLHISVHTSEAGAWVLEDTTIDGNGKPSALPASFSDCVPGPDGNGRTPVEVKPGREALNACFDELTRQGYRQRVKFLPANAFWKLQWREFALYLGATAFLVAFCLRRVNRIQ